MSLTIYEVFLRYKTDPNSGYTKVYQNWVTETLDEVFGLIGESVEDNSLVAHCLNLATEDGALRDTHAERVLRHFADLAKVFGNFVGVPEDQIVENIRSGYINTFSEQDIGIALTYRDKKNAGLPYLIRLEFVAEGTVLFPANLRKPPHLRLVKHD